MTTIGAVTWEHIRELARRQEEARAVIVEANPRLDRSDRFATEREDKRVLRKTVRVQGRTDRALRKAVRVAKRDSEIYRMGGA